MSGSVSSAAVPLEKLRDHFRVPSDPLRLFAKGKKVEVVYAVISKGVPLFRTEGVGDVTLLDLRVSGSTVSVPVILPEKIQAKLRRQMLEILRAHFDDSVKNILSEKYKALGYVKLGNDGSWNCFVAPTLGERETDVGMCGFCPACTILGAVVTRGELRGAGTSYGLKSRVVHDPAYAVTAYEKAVVDLTHTKVGDGLSYTGRALFEEPHVLPGVVFIGKLVLYDLTEREAKLVLAALSSISRLGAGETKYGSVQTLLLGIKGGSYESISAYDIARHIIGRFGGELVEPEVVLKEVLSYLSEKGFELLASFDGKKLDEIHAQITLSEDDVKKLWEEDNYYYANQVVEHIKRVQQEEEEEEEEEGAKSKKKSGKKSVSKGGGT
ncbi:MAG: type I-D CRISPR-associated protein Cas7/Csc2 [Thermofilum sp.]